MNPKRVMYIRQIAETAKTALQIIDSGKLLQSQQEFVRFVLDATGYKGTPYITSSTITKEMFYNPEEILSDLAQLQSASIHGTTNINESINKKYNGITLHTDEGETETVDAYHFGHNAAFYTLLLYLAMCWYRTASVVLPIHKAKEDANQKYTNHLQQFIKQIDLPTQTTTDEQRDSEPTNHTNSNIKQIIDSLGGLLPKKFTTAIEKLYQNGFILIEGDKLKWNTGRKNYPKYYCYYFAKLAKEKFDIEINHTAKILNVKYLEQESKKIPNTKQANNIKAEIEEAFPL